MTVPGDNSLDIYTNDIGCVVITDENGELEGFNVMVGGGMGRTHNKESTFARAADHMGFVKKEDMMELMKCIVATQRDHGNRDVRANARMKYLVHTLGIDNFRQVVESYFGKKMEPWRDMKAWKYSDWMGWWEQGDGKLFYGLHIDNGRVKDEGDFRLKTALRVICDKYNLPMIMSPTQSILLQDINPADKGDIEAIFAEHGEWRRCRGTRRGGEREEQGEVASERNEERWRAKRTRRRCVNVLRTPRAPARFALLPSLPSCLRATRTHCTTGSPSSPSQVLRSWRTSTRLLG